MAENTREIVLDTLLALERGEEFSHRLIKAVLDKHDYLAERDKAFIKRVTEGTIERQIELDYYLDHFSTLPVRKMKPLIRCLMRMSVYQLLYMDNVPDSAVCNEACKLAQKKKMGGLKGFVNGVLRQIARQKEELPLPDARKEPVEFLSVKHSMPAWLVRMWQEAYGEQTTERMLQALLEIRPVLLRFRTDLTDQEQKKAAEAIAAAGVKIRESSLLPYIYIVEGTENLTGLPGFAEGIFLAQDVSSALAVEAAGITPGDFVIDLCAAPGGKSLLAAEKTGREGRVLSRDLSEAKTALIEENRARMRAENITVEARDATVPDESLYGKADVVLADVPCSGLGVIGRKRDIKYRVTMESLQEVRALQRRILEACWRYVKPGGVLLYSTCTLNPAENEEQAAWIESSFPFVLEEQRQFMPGIDDADGFYYARLRRKTETDGKDIKSFTLEELTEEMRSLGEKPFRAKQMYDWMHVKLARDFDEMTNLPKTFREACEKRYTYVSLKVVQVQESAVDGTKKFLFALSDGNLVESVWMRYKHGNSVCISSQVGCRMGCRFCASTLDGLARNLSASEMLDQIYAITLLTRERVSNVVVMGIGEPLDNYDNLLRFIRILTDESGLHISQRNVTVSTCGLVPNMKRLAEEKLQITLALSLHAPTDEKRKKLMPVAERYSIAELMDVCGFYFEKTGRRITFEYSLVGGVNDTDEDAEKLAVLAGKHNCHVNLIPVNPVKERAYAQSKAGRIQAFKKKLEGYGVTATVRRELGRDIDGACGQLRRKNLNVPE